MNLFSDLRLVVVGLAYVGSPLAFEFGKRPCVVGFEINPKHTAELLNCIDKSLVKIQNFTSSKNNFKYLYLLASMGLAEKLVLTERFLSRKTEAYGALKTGIEALQSEVDALGQDKTQIG